MEDISKAVGAKTLIPNGAFALLMALTPKNVDIEYIWGDENINPIEWDLDCDLVAITGFTLHFDRMKYISEKFRKRGIPVAMGGPHVTMNPEECKPFADFLFIGEGELIWKQFLIDWSKNKAESTYCQPDYISLENSPAPDWSLINRVDYVCITLQTPTRMSS